MLLLLGAVRISDWQYYAIHQRPLTLSRIEKECRGQAVDVHDKEACDPLYWDHWMGPALHHSPQKFLNSDQVLKSQQTNFCASHLKIHWISYPPARMAATWVLPNSVRSLGYTLDGLESWESTLSCLGDVAYVSCLLGICAWNQPHF